MIFKLPKQRRLLWTASIGVLKGFLAVEGVSIVSAVKSVGISLVGKINGPRTMKKSLVDITYSIYCSV